MAGNGGQKSEQCRSATRSDGTDVTGLFCPNCSLPLRKIGGLPERPLVTCGKCGSLFILETATEYR